jgi:hypothetical protein
LRQYCYYWAVIIWPAIRSYGSTDRNHLTQGMTKAVNGSSYVLQLAKHGDDDDEGEYLHHKKHHRRHQFCGPYFTSNAVPYFRCAGSSKAKTSQTITNSRN